MDCIINTSPDGPPLRAADRAAILDALRGIKSGPRFVELRIESQLDEGFSTARVFEGCLVPADGGEERRVVVKVDTQARLQQELKAAAICGREKNVAPIMAPIELVRRGPQDRGAIIYEHASEPWPGELRSLRTVVRAALGDPGARENALNLVARTLGCLDRQVHAKARVELTPSCQLDFYLTRWLPGAHLRVDDVDPGARRLHLCVGRGQPEPLTLELGRKDVLFAPDGSSRPIHEGTGEMVSILISELRVVDGSIVARIPGEGAVHIDTNPPVVAAVAAWIAAEGLAADAALSYVHLCGELTATRHSGYAQLVAAVGLDPASERWELAGMTVKNPLLGLQGTAWSWCSRGSRSEFVFGHGDLHGGNALCVGQDVAIIDLGLAGERQPRWADAARLIGSLWRDSIAPQLGTDEIVRALVAAFRSESAPALTATDRGEAAAALLRGAFDRAIAAPKSADRVLSRRELWIDLHHFCWVALKWSLADRLDEDAAQRRVLAMALLAAIAAESVDHERQAILRHRDTDVLKDTRAVGATLHERFEREGDAHGLLTYRAESRTNLLRLEGLALAKPTLRTAYLSAHLERAILMPEWGDAEVAEINDLRARVEDSLDPPEEALLADALLFGCSRRWNDRAFLALLDLCESGEERVAIEAYLALGLLLERPATQHALARHERLRKRLSRTLTRPEALIVLAEIGRAFSEPLPIFDEKILQSPTLSGSRPRELAWMLRPYRAVDHGPSAVDSERSTLLVGLEDSHSLSDMEKHMITAGEASLSSFQRSELIKIFATEQQQFSRLGGSRLHYCLWTRLASLGQIGGLAHFALPSLDLAARRIARTLSDVLEDERAVGEFTRLVLVRQLFAKEGRTLLMLEALCALPKEAAVTEREAQLVLAIERGACEAFLGLLPLLGVSRASPGLIDSIQAYAGELLHTLGAELTGGSENDGGISTKVQAIAQKWAAAPQAREVFSPSVFEWFVTHLFMTTEGFDASEIGSFALFMKRQKRLDEAERLYQRAVDADPHDANILGDFAVFIEQQGRSDEAERLYRQALDADPRHANNLGNFADFMERDRGNAEEAESLYRQAVNADPRNARHLQNFALSMERRGEHEEAERLYRQAVDADPRNANSLGNFALFMARRGEHAEAERFYRQAVEADPRHANNLGNFAVFMEQRGMNDEAERLYRQAVDAEPRNAHILGNFADFMEKARGETEEAERLYRQAVDAEPRNANNLGCFARFMTRRGDLEEAKRLCRQILDAEPRNANSLGNFALFMERRGEHAEAERFYRQAVEADPRHAHNLGNFALFMKRRGKPEEAERLYRQAIDADPRNAHNLGNFALFMEQRGMNEEAEHLYRQAVDADPRHTNSLGGFALFMERRGEHAEAERFYRQAVEAGPRNAHNLGNFALFMKRRGKPEEAERLYRQAIDADPRNAHNLGNFALFMEQRGMNEEAERLYRQAEDADPRHTNSLGNFASFMTRRGVEEAERLYRQALDADPRHANNLGNFAGALFAWGRPEEAANMVIRSRDGVGIEDALLLELHFYEYAHVAGAREAAAAEIEAALTRGVRSPGFDLSRNVQRALEDGHPDPARLQSFATAISAHE